MEMFCKVHGKMQTLSESGMHTNMFSTEVTLCEWRDDEREQTIMEIYEITMVAVGKSRDDLDDVAFDSDLQIVNYVH